jgi:hypothetical protein
LLPSSPPPLPTWAVVLSLDFTTTGEAVPNIPVRSRDFTGGALLECARGWVGVLIRIGVLCRARGELLPPPPPPAAPPPPPPLMWAGTVVTSCSWMCSTIRTGVRGSSHRLGGGTSLIALFCRNKCNTNINNLASNPGVREICGAA